MNARPYSTVKQPKARNRVKCQGPLDLLCDYYRKYLLTKNKVNQVKAQVKDLCFVLVPILTLPAHRQFSYPISQNPHRLKYLPLL